MLAAVRKHGASGDDSPVLIPSQLVVREGGAHVWVIDPSGDRAMLRPVTLGSVQGEWTEVISGINLTDKLIERGRERLDPGSRIHILGGQ